jgi:hypothetical protein
MKLIQLSMMALGLLTPAPTWAEQIPVHHVEGVTFGFLTLRDTAGQIIADGYLQQSAKPGTGVITNDVQFHFRDGSLYREITKFTQRGVFHLISNQVTQKGPAFKRDSESLIEVGSGKVMYRTSENGKQKQSVKQLKLPADVSNGMLSILTKNINPAVESTVSMVAMSDKPRIVKLIFRPAEEQAVRFGKLEFKTQHYVMKVKIEGAAGKIAPLIGKQPPDAQFWVVKSEAPTFVAFEGPLGQDTPVWRIEFGAPEQGSGVRHPAETKP